MNILMAIHIAGGLAALPAGTIAVAARKGGRLHTRAGNVFFASMLVLGVTAAILEPFRTPVPGSPITGLFVLQLLSIVIGWIGNAISTPAHPVDIDAGFSVNGWLAVLLTFVLARVFTEGAGMREDLEGTV